MRLIIKKIVVWILTLEARLVLHKYRPKIVGITGSVGKSSTKDAIYSALSASFFVRKSQKSFNSELGIPLTILGCENAWNNPFLWFRNIFQGLAIILLPNHYPEWLILEVGLDRPGDIRNVVRWIAFDVVVYTRLSELPVHVEFFDSVEALLLEKAELMRGLKQGGTLIINGDDPLQKDFTKEGAKRLTYGLEESSRVYANHIETSYKDGRPVGVNFRIDYEGASVPIELTGVIGIQHIYPVLAGCAVGVSVGVNLVELGEVFIHHTYLPGRMRILEGRDGVTIIDDSYNASPVATHAALDVLYELKTDGRKIFVLGDMTELGKLTVEAHKIIGEHVARVADMFVAVGQRMDSAAQAALKAGMPEQYVDSFATSREAGEHIRDRLQKGDIVLVKGSQSIRMERTVEKLLAYPEHVRTLLARQDREWLKR